jgi:hypothetical protein
MTMPWSSRRPSKGSNTTHTTRVGAAGEHDPAVPGASADSSKSSGHTKPILDDKSPGVRRIEIIGEFFDGWHKWVLFFFIFLVSCTSDPQPSRHQLTTQTFMGRLPFHLYEPFTNQSSAYMLMYAGWTGQCDTPTKLTPPPVSANQPKYPPSASYAQSWPLLLSLHMPRLVITLAESQSCSSAPCSTLSVSCNRPGIRSPSRGTS